MSAPKDSEVLQWVEGCRKGNRRAQHKLFRHFYPVMYLFAPTFLPESAPKPENSMSRAGVFGTIVSYGYSGERLGRHSHFIVELAYGPATTGFVRCVKD